MKDSYAMVFTSLFAVFALVFFVFLTRYFFSKKKFSLLLLTAGIAVLPLINMWRPGLYESGDMGSHVIFLISFFHSLQQGVFFPRWSAEFCNGYGYPHMQFFYFLPYYLGSFFHVLGLSFINSIKLIFSISFIGAGISMFCWLREEFDERAAFVGSIFYLFAPYQLIDLHFTGALGECLAFAIAPLILLCAKKTTVRKQLSRWHIAFVILYIALIFTHHIVPILFLPFVLFYFWLCWRLQKKRSGFEFIWIFVSLVIIFSLTAFHWLPIVLENGLIQQSQMKSFETNYLWQFFFSPWQYGFLFEGHYGEVSPLIGYAQIVVFFFALKIYFTQKIKKNDKVFLRFFLISTVAVFIFMQSFTLQLWLKIPILDAFQTTRRLLFLMTILNAGIAAVTSKYIKSKVFFSMLIAFAVLSTTLNWQPRALVTNRNDQTLTAEIPSRCDWVTIPTWVTQQTQENVLLYRKSDLEVIKGDAEYVKLPSSFVQHEYVISVKTEATLRENTIYFPAWVAYLNGVQQPILFNDPSAPGIMEFHLQPGLYNLTLKYQFTTIEQLAWKISVFALFGCTIIVVVLRHHE